MRRSSFPDSSADGHFLPQEGGRRPDAGISERAHHPSSPGRFWRVLDAPLTRVETFISSSLDERPPSRGTFYVDRSTNAIAAIASQAETRKAAAIGSVDPVRDL